MTNSALNNFSPAHPFVVAFSVLDPTVSRMGGGVHGATLRFADRLEWLLNERGLTSTRLSLLSEVYFSIKRFEGMHLKLLILAVERHADRHQWCVHFWTDPDYPGLIDVQRAKLRELHEAVTQLFVAAEEVEDVEVPVWND